MNKTVVGWVMAALLGFAFLATAIVLIIVGVMFASTSTELDTTKTNLTAANQTIEELDLELEQTSNELADANADISGLNNDLKDSQSALSAMTKEKNDLQSKYNVTVCEATESLDYSSYSSMQKGLADFAKSLSEVGSITNNNLVYGYLDFKDFWKVEILYKAPGGGSSFLIFIAFPDDEATYFSNMGCWLDPL